MKDLDKLIKEIYTYKRYGIRLGLDRIEYIVKKLGNPQNNFRVIHVGGTNGKGSVCRFIESVLRKAGYKVGLYTSPHLLDFRERFLVNGEMINKDELHRVLKKILSIAEHMNDKPTFFEISTACAFEYFSEREVDFGIVEVGLGGRYDATNVVSPEITVITNVEKDHTDILSDDIRKIALEKAGIIKRGVPLITGCDERILDILKAEARRKRAEIISMGKWNRIACYPGWQVFEVEGLLGNYILKTRMMGRFQGFNLSLAVTTIDKLQMMGTYIPDSSLEKGIEDAFHPGRMHIISRDPFILLDGAHNLSAIRSLKESIIEDFDYKKLIAVIGMLRDKEYRRMIEEIGSISDITIVTKPDNLRACDPEELYKYINGEKRITKNVPDALNMAVDIANKEDMICVTGSLYTVSEAMRHILH